MNRTPTEITAEILKLERIKGDMQSAGLLHDRNHDKLNAQIAVLDHRMDAEEIIELHEEAEGGDLWLHPDVADAAKESAAWLWHPKDNTPPPSLGWLALVEE